MSSKSQDRMDPAEELVRLQILHLRREFPNQKDLILELTRAGFKPSRIAELIGTTANTVSVTLVQAKNAEKRKTNAANKS